MTPSDRAKIEVVVEAVVTVLQREGIEVDIVMRADMVMEAEIALRRASVAHEATARTPLPELLADRSG